MNMPFIRSFPIVIRLSEEENVTENLKATAPMEWVKRSNNIRNRADEIVNRELIFYKDLWLAEEHLQAIF